MLTLFCWKLQTTLEKICYQPFWHNLFNNLHPREDCTERVRERSRGCSHKLKIPLISLFSNGNVVTMITPHPQITHRYTTLIADEIRWIRKCIVIYIEMIKIFRRTTNQNGTIITKRKTTKWLQRPVRKMENKKKTSVRCKYIYTH